MNLWKAILTFVIGMILSLGIGSNYNDSGVGVMISVCYVGAIIVGLFHDRRKSE